jgi:hypothetical protein
MQALRAFTKAVLCGCLSMVVSIVPAAGQPSAAAIDIAADDLLRWPLPAGAERYAGIDGKHMHRDVVAHARN